MRPVRVVEGRAVPLGRSDVDTDQIIPSEWLKRVERTGFGHGLFSEWRDDPDFVLNRPEYAGASILVGAERFGTGSSREHAVWALLDYGFAAVVASSFGDIFSTNAAKQGLVVVRLEPGALAELVALVEADPTRHVTVDVERLVVEVPDAGWRRGFDLEPMTRERLLQGWDDIGLSLRHDAEITAFESRHGGQTPVSRLAAR